MPRQLPPLESNDLLIIIGDQQVTIRRYTRLVAQLQQEIDTLKKRGAQTIDTTSQGGDA